MLFRDHVYPGSSDWRLASEVQVTAGSLNGVVNLQVSPRAAMPVNSVRTYGYPYGIAEGPPPITVEAAAPLTLVLAGNGLVDNTGQLRQGLSFDTPGWLLQILPGTTRLYQGFAAVDVRADAYGVPHVVIAGARHLIVNSSDNVYVLPAAMHAVTGPAPAITGIQALASGTVAVNGTNLSSQTRIVFDGAAGTLVNAVSNQQLIVSLPLARPGFVAHVEALNPDGQSSLYISGDSGVTTYTWPGSDAPSLAVTSGTLPAGRSMTVDVIGTNINFVQGQTFVGFGTSNVAVSNVVVVSPVHLQVTATAAAGTSIPTTAINVTTGLSVISKALGYGVTGM